MIKVWCLHCEMVTEFHVEKHIGYPKNIKCSNCGAGFLDVEACTDAGGFFRRVYPDIKYEDIVVNKRYPLYLYMKE